MTFDAGDFLPVLRNLLLQIIPARQMATHNPSKHSPRKSSHQLEHVNPLVKCPHI